MSWQMAQGSIGEADDSDVHQRAAFKGIAGESFTRVTRLQQHGLSSVPPPGARGLIGFAGAHREVAYALGFEHEEHRPRNQPMGSTVLYDHAGGILSIINKNVRVVCGTYTVEAEGDIVLSTSGGTVKLGGAGADKRVGMLGSVDDDGDVLTGGLATKVYAL